MTIIHSFDPNKKAIINPEDMLERTDKTVDIAIATFSHKIIEVLIKNTEVEIIGESVSVNGTQPFYKMKYKGKDIAFYMTLVGSSITAAMLEEAIVILGIKKLIVFGTCGVLNKDITSGKIIVPTEAYRDEGTSYHYVEPSDYIKLENSNQLASILDELNVSHVKGKIWTTDGIYRETKDNMKKRKDEGCICVDMECSAIQAVCSFRNIELYQFVYGADNLDADNWDPRILRNHHISEKMKYMNLALEIALRI